MNVAIAGADLIGTTRHYLGDQGEATVTITEYRGLGFFTVSDGHTSFGAQAFELGLTEATA